ncbi:MAG: signal peptidase I [Deltaproteobacteria bacterium]|nr:MAG: signal peptidase I [Deltaproteobacteria bacterium]
MEKENTKGVFREYAESIFIAVILALFIRTFIVQAFKIPSESMVPTLLVGDHLLVNKFIYGIKIPVKGTMLIPISKPKQYDIIVFRYPNNPKIDYIKRVIAVPGDRVEIINRVVYVNGKEIADPAANFVTESPMPKGTIDPRNRVFEDRGNKDNFGPLQVPEGKWFVMGDNRDRSADSRFWGFVGEDKILGKAMIIYWSWDIDKPLFSLDRLSSIQFGRIGNIIR